MAGLLPPDYDDVRMGGPSGLRIPAEQGKATFALKYQVSINVGGAGSTNLVTLTPQQTMGSEYVLTNAGSGITTINWATQGQPGLIFVVYNNSGQASALEVAGANSIAVSYTHLTLPTIYSV